MNYLKMLWNSVPAYLRPFILTPLVLAGVISTLIILYSIINVHVIPVILCSIMIGMGIMLLYIARDEYATYPQHKNYVIPAILSAIFFSSVVVTILLLIFVG